MNSYLFLCLLVLMCGGSKSNVDDAKTSYSRQKGEAVEGIRIAWDYGSMQKLAPQGSRIVSWAGYPRVRRLKDGTLMAVYDVDGNGEMVESNDQGKTWSAPVVTFKKHLYTNTNRESTPVNIANSELCQLHNGDLIMACNYRPAKDEIAPLSLPYEEAQILAKHGQRTRLFSRQETVLSMAVGSHPSYSFPMGNFRSILPMRLPLHHPMNKIFQCFLRPIMGIPGVKR